MLMMLLFSRTTILSGNMSILPWQNLLHLFFQEKDYPERMVQPRPA